MRDKEEMTLMEGPINSSQDKYWYKNIPIIIIALRLTMIIYSLGSIKRNGMEDQSDLRVTLT